MRSAWLWGTVVSALLFTGCWTTGEMGKHTGTQVVLDGKDFRIVKENVQAETRLMVANIAAEAEKEAAQTDAQAQLEVAGIRQQVAELEANRIRILGRATADVEKMANAAEAEGYRMLVDAFGSPSAYNLYTFAENFQPDSIRLFFAGEGTFWTDLNRLQDAASMEFLRSSTAPKESGRRPAREQPRKQ